MHDDPLAGIDLFSLTITLDPDGIEWTHFVSAGGLILTPQELPKPLWRRVKPFVRHLSTQHITTFEFLPTHAPYVKINGTWHDPSTSVSDESFQTICLLSWWMEWQDRKKRTPEEWTCPTCGQLVNPRGRYCKNSECDSWDILFEITGETTLRPAQTLKTGTNSS